MMVGNLPDSLRYTREGEEMAYLVLVQSVTNGKMESEVEWCESRALAEQYANKELAEAKEGDYDISVFVLKSIKQGDTK